MRAEIKLMTPELAEELLKKNKGNRKIKTVKDFYSKQMKNGEWKENGEPIIIDKNGIIKDGQHRLIAVISSKHKYEVPIIYDVNPDVMDTIDTGTNRSLSDILQLNGFLYSTHVASLTKAIIKYKSEASASFMVGGSSGGGLSVKGGTYVSNSNGLNYAIKHKEEMLELIQYSSRLYDKQSYKTFTVKEIAFMFYVISGYDSVSEHRDFIKNVLGIRIMEGTPTNWLYNKHLKARVDGDRLLSKWVKSAFIRVWNLYVDGNVPVSRLSIKLDSLEKVKSI